MPNRFEFDVERDPEAPLSPEEERDLRIEEWAKLAYNGTALTGEERERIKVRDLSFRETAKHRAPGTNPSFEDGGDYRYYKDKYEKAEKARLAAEAAKTQQQPEPHRVALPQVGGLLRRKGA